MQLELLWKGSHGASNQALHRAFNQFQSVRKYLLESYKSNGDPAMPLLDALVERGNRQKDLPFHVPGHKASLIIKLWIKLL
jgi:hypothetical protein